MIPQKPLFDMRNLYQRPCRVHGFAGQMVISERCMSFLTRPPTTRLRSRMPSRQDWDSEQKIQHIDIWLEHFARRLPGADFKDGVLNLGEGGIHFVGSDLRNSKLWIRPCYEHLTDMIREKINDGSKSRFVIIGSPGIGKTMYSYLWLYDLAFECQRVVYQYSTNMRFLFDWSSASKQPFVRSGSGEDFNEELMQAKTWFLIDGRANLGNEPMRFNARCIVFTCSPNPQEYQYFAKTREALKLYMPVWSESEVMICRKKLYKDKPEKEVLGRVSTYGGLARYIFDKTNVECIVDFKEAMDSLSSFDTIFEAVGGSSNPLLYLLPQFFGVKDTNFQYYGFRVEFGSKFLANEVLANLVPMNETQIFTWVEAGINDIFAGMRGQIQQYFHQKGLSPKRIRGGDASSLICKKASSCSSLVGSLITTPPGQKLLTYTEHADSDSTASEETVDEKELDEFERSHDLKERRMRKMEQRERRNKLQIHKQSMERIRREKEAMEAQELARLHSERERLGRVIEFLERRSRRGSSGNK